MEKEIIIERLTSVFRKVFKRDDLVLCDDMSAADIEEWNSLTHMALVFEIEEAFGVKIKLKDLVSWKQVGDIIATLDKKLNGN